MSLQTNFLTKGFVALRTIVLFGFFVGISRMRDRIVFTKIKNICYSFTCRRHKRVGYVEFDKIVEKSQMNTFLKTSLNTELVITILKGVLILAASSSDKIDHMDDQDMYRIRQTTTIELQKIKIKDASQPAEVDKALDLWRKALAAA